MNCSSAAAGSNAAAAALQTLQDALCGCARRLRSNCSWFPDFPRYLGPSRRACYVLEVVHAPGAVEPLLAILIRCCQAGKDVADQARRREGGGERRPFPKGDVVGRATRPGLQQAWSRRAAAQVCHTLSLQVAETNGLEGALRAVLSAPVPGEAAGAAEVAYAAARPLALRLLRQLAQASKAAARLLLERGLVRCALDELLRPTLWLRGGGGSSAGSADAATPVVAAPPGEPAAVPAQRRHELGMRSEALRLWRCLAMHDLYLLHLDDAYPGLCRCFEPLTVATAAALGVDGSDDGGAAAQDRAEAPAAGRAAELELEQLALAREAYLLASELCWQAAASDDGGMISVECAAGLERQAAGWLAALPAERLLQACTQLASGLVQSNHVTQAVPKAAAMPRQALLSAYPALPAPLAVAAPEQQRWQAAVVLVSTLAAVLQFEASFWSTGALEVRPAAAMELQRAGWLPLPGTGSGALLAANELLQAAAPLAAAGGLAGGALAAAACDLGMAAARLEAVLLQASGGAAVLLAPLRSQATAATLLTAAAEHDSTLQQPWDAARHQRLLVLARAALASLQAAVAVDPGARPAAHADLALALLQVLPPGAEADALQALGLLLSPQQVAAARAVADAALVASDGIGKLAGGNRPDLPPARQLAAGALAGYATAWLDLVPSDPSSLQQQGVGQAGEQQQQQPGPAAAFLQPLPTAAVLRPSGSRLPLPSEWALLETPVLPAAGANLDAASGTALLLVLGWEQLDLASLARVPPGAKLKAAVQLVFGDRPLGGVAQEPAAGGSTSREEPWQQPLARWCLAALMHHYCEAEALASSAGTPAQSPWKHQEAKQLAERYASESFGHPLFGAAVALLLRAPVPLDTQVRGGTGKGQLTAAAAILGSLCSALSVPRPSDCFTIHPYHSWNCCRLWPMNERYTCCRRSRYCLVPRFPTSTRRRRPDPPPPAPVPMASPAHPAPGWQLRPI